MPRWIRRPVVEDWCSSTECRDLLSRCLAGMRFADALTVWSEDHGVTLPRPAAFLRPAAEIRVDPDDEPPPFELVQQVWQQLGWTNGLSARMQGIEHWTPTTREEMRN